MSNLGLALKSGNISEMIRSALKENTNDFVQSLLEVANSDKYIQQCNPQELIKEAMKAATLRLPLNRQLGFAYIVARKGKDGYTPTFQIGYKGYIQLAIRTNQYQKINAGVIYDGMIVRRDIITGDIQITGEAKNDTVIGYIAYLKLKSGFEKTIFMSKKEIEAHAKRFSTSYGHPSAPWSTDFDAMSLKTVIKKLLTKWGALESSIQKAAISDVDDEKDVETEQTTIQDVSLQQGAKIEALEDNQKQDTLLLVSEEAPF